jgi:hypothetical protein
MRVLSLAVLALLGVQAIEPTRPGLGASITGQGITNAKNIIAPLIFTKLQNLQIPEIDISGGKFTNLQISLPQPSLNNINVGFDGANNGIELNVQQASGEIKSDFTYTYLITVNGAADIKIKNIGVDFDIGLETQPGTPSTELAPKLKVVKSIVTIDPADVDVTLSGSLVAKIAGLLVPLIKSSLIPTIVSTVEQTINDTINQTVNPDLQKYGNEITIPYLAGVTFDYSQYNGGPQIASDGSMGQIALNGTFWDIQKPETYSIEPTAFPVHNPAGKSLQGYLTDYVVNTMLQSGFDTGNTLDITYLLEKYLGITVITDWIGLFIPEFVSTYGTGQAVQISASFSKAPGMASVTSDLAEIVLNLKGTFKVGDSVAVAGELDNINFAAFIKAVDGVLTGNISKSSMGALSNFQTSLGITGDHFLSELQGSISKYISVANSDLATGIQITKVFGVDVHDVEVNFSNGWIEGGINATPATFEGLQDLWGAYKTHYDEILAGKFQTTKYSVDEVKSFLQ